MDLIFFSHLSQEAAKMTKKIIWIDDADFGLMKTLKPPEEHLIVPTKKN